MRTCAQTFKSPPTDAEKCGNLTSLIENVVLIEKVRE